ncbi:mandelate racemase/muconate lactonizing enzyme family protein [Halobaculum sp. WSA2]|uniref:Mandelate racemase/muconate lactonizing enzyme family protein n=1 Tax=Halobaculum saliterrae TaxID=2073113 RepID=A0A6B0SSJ9_9EURY|nr:mandelate racemase/muconate lactonizing enzyme family protein [Halobaculum saliterrae]MXR41928.1 mandelate racemase/muconate lactonizing enzyme family protein [Halobaculum saliterrae]
MEIREIRTVPLAVDLDEPARLSRDRAIDRRAAALVVVETAGGSRGIGEAVGPAPATTERLIDAELAPKLVGEDPLDVERHWTAMCTESLYDHPRGERIAAASGIDIALWDLVGKHHGAPVHRLLGGDAGATAAPDGRLRAYASDLFFDDPDAMAERAAGYVDRGFDAVKCHLGRGRDADEARVAAMREAIGDAELMVDVNCGYDRAEARRVGHMLADYDVYWYEEPLEPRDVEGLAELRRALETPIATGENRFTKWGFRELFEAGAVDYAMPDAMRCGGITETRKVLALAEAFDVVPTPHCFATGVGLAATMQTMATSPAAQWLELDVTDFPLLEPLLVDGLDLADGSVGVPTGPGLGVEIPDPVVAEYGTA